MPEEERTFIPAAGSDWFLPYYDIFTKLLGVDSSHRRLLEQAEICTGFHVLEIGFGTGNLAILAKRQTPSATVVGIDPDEKALSRARSKAHKKSLEVESRQAFSEELPFTEAAFDRVLSAFVLHHVQTESKMLILREVYRVLKPGGSLHLVDFSQEGNSRPGHFNAGHPIGERSRLHQEIPQLMQEAGFLDCAEVDHQASLIGRIGYFRALR